MEVDSFKYLESVVSVVGVDSKDGGADADFKKRDSHFGC